MSLSAKLIWRDICSNKGRMAVSVFAIFVSISLIVWTMGSYDTLVEEFDNDAEAYMGYYDVCIVPETRPGPPAPQVATFAHHQLTVQLGNLATVEQVNPVWQVPRLQIGCDNERGTFEEQVRDRMGIPPQSPVLVGGCAEECPYELEEGVWPNMATSSALEGVLGSAAAELFQARVGTMMKIRVGDKIHEVKVVGIVKQAKSTPGIVRGVKVGGPALSSFFVPVNVCESLMGGTFRPNLIYIRLKEGVEKQVFVRSIQPLLTEAKAVVSDTDAIIQRLTNDRSVKSQKDSAEMSVWLVLFSCVFIIFTSLSIGVNEKTHRLALLRVLGLSRRQIALLIIGEGLILCIPALLGGLLAGTALVYLDNESAVMPTLSWQTVGLATVCAIGGAFLASLIPAWRASRQLPIEAASPGVGVMERVGHVPMWSLFLGVLCLTLQPLSLLLPGLEVEWRKWMFFWLGYPGLVCGALLLAPICVRVTEWVFGRFFGCLMRVPYAFLKLQLSRHLMRTVGTTVSMALGLSLFVAIQTWGYSMLVPFTPSDKTPSTLVSFLYVKFQESDTDELMARSSLQGAKMYPIYVDEPDIVSQQFKEFAKSGLQNKSVVLTGIPVAEMTGGDVSLFKPEFVEGSAESAYQMLVSEPSVIIPDTFARQVGLKVGDVLYLETPRTTKRPAWMKKNNIAPHTSSIQSECRNNELIAKQRGVTMGTGDSGESWKVAGIISFPGWHWLTKTSGMRVRRGGQVASMAITDARWVKEKYGHDSYQFIWGETPKSVTSEQLQFDLGEFAQKKAVEKSGDTSVKPFVKALTRESLDAAVTKRGDSVIFTMSQLPLIMIVIAVLSVLNTVLASVQSRRREFGLMRAVGVPAGLLVRMLWVETMMISMCSIVMSLGIGVLAAWGGIQILEYGYHFGIVTPPITMPWGHLFYAVLLVLGLSSVACLVPAWRMKRVAALELLQKIDR